MGLWVYGVGMAGHGSGGWGRERSRREGRLVLVLLVAQYGERAALEWLDERWGQR